MPIIYTAENPLDPKSWVRHEVPHVGQFLLQHFNGSWPETGRIYAGQICKACDITPCERRGITPESLEGYSEALWVVIHPGTGVEAAIAIGVVALAASVAAVLLIPDPQSIDTGREKSNVQGSPNNSLSDRGNKVRIGARVPQFFGRSRVVPDLLAVPYVVYEDHREKEIAYYCVTEGLASILDARDGDTDIAQIPGASAHAYGPGEAPTGAGPHTGTLLAIGDPIVDPVLTTYQVEAVNGQVIEPFNAFKVYGPAKKPDVDGDTSTDPGIFQFFNVTKVQHTGETTGRFYLPFLKNADYVKDRIKVGDQLFIFMPTAGMPSSSNPTPDLNSTTTTSPLEPTEDFPLSPTVTALVDDPGHPDFVAVDVTIPAALQAQWALVPAYISGLLVAPITAGTFDTYRSEFTPVDHLYQGPFFVDFEHVPGSSNEEVICNFVAPNGMYSDDGVTTQKLSSAIEIRITPANDAGVPTGVSQFATAQLNGSDITSGNQRAITIRVPRSSTGKFLLSARRLTDRPRREELPPLVETVDYAGVEAYTGRVVDEIKWVHAYSSSTPPQISFGDVTTIHTQTVATEGATSVRRRQLNCFAARRIQTWDGSVFGGTPVENSDAENVAFTLMKSATVGNLPDEQIDFAGIAAAFEAVRSYFNPAGGSDTEATQVTYTFDDLNLSLEESLTIVGNLAFGVFYRQGNVIKCNPDIDTDVAKGIFNQRNILPDSQEITHTFGPTTENDSIEVDYRDPFDERADSVIVPVLGPNNAIKSLRVVGLRTRRQAMWHAYRGLFRMLHQRQALQMTTTQEATELVVKDRVLVADLTRANVQAGNITKVNGLVVTTSQPPVFEPSTNYTMFLWHADNTVEAISATSAGSNTGAVLLGSAPSQPIIVDSAVGVPTLYNLVADSQVMPRAYQVSDKSAQSNLTFNVSAVNYSHMYYVGDALDFWMSSTIQDLSPAERTSSALSLVPTINDPDRGPMMSFNGSNEVTVAENDPHDPTHGWSAACWVRHNDGTDDGFRGLVETVDQNAVFGFFNNDVAAGHNGGIAVQFPVQFGELHMVAVTWDASTTLMRLFVDGVEVDSATVAASATPDTHRYCSLFPGAVGDLMRWRRTLSPSAIHEWYTKTKTTP